MNRFWLGEGLNEKVLRVRAQNKQRLGNAVACLGRRVKAGWERVLSGEMSLDRCVRIKS